MKAINKKKSSGKTTTSYVSSPVQKKRNLKSRIGIKYWSLSKQILFVVLPSLLALIGAIDIFYGYPGVCAGINKQIKLRQLEHLYKSKKGNEMVGLLRSIKENPNLADEFYFYSGLLRVDNPGAYPGGPRLFFENIKPNSSYFDRSLKLHLKYISNIQSTSSKFDEIEYFQKNRIQGNILNEYYYISELYKLVWITLDKHTTSITFSPEYDNWQRTLNKFRETYYFVYFGHFPFRWSTTQTEERKYVMNCTPELIMSVTSVEFILQLGLYLTSETQPISIQKNHLLRLETMLNLNPPSEPVWFDSLYRATHPKIVSVGAKIDLAECLDNYGLSQVMQFVNEKLGQIKTSRHSIK
jgi:hypothetical protein